MQALVVSFVIRSVKSPNFDESAVLNARCTLTSSLKSSNYQIDWLSRISSDFKQADSNPVMI